MPKVIHLAVACVATMVAVTLPGCSDAKQSKAYNGPSMHSSADLALLRREALRMEELSSDPSLPDDGRREWAKAKSLTLSLLDDGKAGVGFQAALPWYRKSAEKGYFQSQDTLTSYYDPSSGAGKYCGNKVERYAWTAVLIHRYENMDRDKEGEFLARTVAAATVGDRTIHPLERRKNSLETIELTPEELTQAKTLAAEYIENDVPRKE